MSVVMGVYDAERFLADAIASVLEQSLAELELVVVDDGSTDASAQILERAAARDPRVVVHRQANAGHAAALNAGVRLARAPLIARLDADDVSLPDRLARQVDFMASNERVALLGGAARFVDASGRALEESRPPLADAEIRVAFAHTTPFMHPSVMFRKSAFEQVGGYRTCFAESEDLDLWLRIAEHHAVANLPELLIDYRVHGGQTTTRSFDRQALEVVAAHLSARARAQRRPDPLDGVVSIDERWLLEHGVERRAITAEIVKSATWVAKVVARAGHTERADALLDAALARARSERGAAGLLATVHRARALRHDAQGQRLRAGFARGRAVLAQLRA